MTPAELYPLLEKGGLLAGLILAVHYLLRRLERSQAELVGMMAGTIERNTEALIKLDAIVSNCRSGNGNAGSNGDTHLLRKPFSTPSHHPNP